ncbi:MAG: PhzF family phenazine biosynthesis protein [Desulfobacteraceae bacterium]|nr:MAG: PhzF family phenazine biosynthesis protein [Desulfobacteraceae bacterium]
MKIPIYQIDAFASAVFSGNPAAVCILDSWLDDKVLQGIAAENNLSETAFLVRNREGFDLRWFTPATEVALCGHATLASAFVLFSCLGWKDELIRFRTRKSGELVVGRRGDLLEMDFPARPGHATDPPAALFEALGVEKNPPRSISIKGGSSLPRAMGVFGSAEDILVLLDSGKSVRELQPDFAALGKVECRGVIVTAKGDRSDFVSRFFAPRVGINEDPVTGSAHCVLIPYWAGVLGKKSLHALQVSRRGGELFCEDRGDRVRIAGRAVLYMEGKIVL